MSRYRPVKPIIDNIKIWRQTDESPFVPRSDILKPVEDIQPQTEQENLIGSPVTERDTYKQKLISILNAQNAFNRIKFSESAPDYAAFMPAHVTKNLRDWWFFNQDDYKTVTLT
ncbi:uncharacterized protein [Battus philenor]|uniref:uncharacterized protein n=1 Tax=Battus philenor TaxID=42288 RepID=UPI0035CFE0EB